MPTQPFPTSHSVARLRSISDGIDAIDEAVVAAFVARQTQVAEGVTSAWNGSIRLRVKALFGNESAPSKFVTGVRGIVASCGEVLIMQNRDGFHLTPGGRVEAGESLQGALARELSEETGITPTRLERVATLVFAHETARPDNYPYPFPVFMNEVFWVETHSRTVNPEDPDDFEIEGKFVPRAALGTYSPPQYQLQLLHFLLECGRVTL